MIKKRLNNATPLRHPNLGWLRFGLDIFVIILVFVSFLLFVFVVIPSKSFLIALAIGAVYTYLLRKWF